jgi:hypothetical protein
VFQPSEGIWNLAEVKEKTKRLATFRLGNEMKKKEDD